METVQGWECPKCHATYAPWVSRCQRCYEAGEPKEFRVGIKEVMDADRMFQELYRTSQTNTRKITTAPAPITLTSGDVVKGFAGEA